MRGRPIKIRPINHDMGHPDFGGTNEEDHIFISKKILRKHHNALDLSKDVQSEVDSLLRNVGKELVDREAKRHGDLRKPSPYVVNLKRQTTEERISDTTLIQHNTINLLVFPDHEIRDQFTPLKDTSFAIPGTRRLWVRIFVVVMFFFIIGNGIYSYLRLNRVLDYISRMTEQAGEHLVDGYAALRVGSYDHANVYFSMATREFLEAEKELTILNPLWIGVIKNLPIINGKLESGYNALLAGERLSLAAKYFTKGISTVQSDIPVTDKFLEIKTVANETALLLTEAMNYLDHVDMNHVPTSHRAYVGRAKEFLPLAIRASLNAGYLSDFLTIVAGHEEKKRYLFVFQNNAELRSSGGFIGSFALVDLYKGRITNIEVPNTGSYQLQGGLRKNIIPPRPLQLIAERWEFQDANWSPHFPDSARMIEYLFSNSWGSTVDGVVAVNLPVMEELLKIVGPIEMKEYGKILTSENFWIEVQRAVEIEYDKKQNNPKQIISDLTPVLFDKITNGSTELMSSIMLSANQALVEKNIQMYFKDVDAQRLVSEYGWDGAMRMIGGDYLAVVVNNIAGGKTDRVITQSFDHISDIKSDGSIINTLTIHRVHNGRKGDEFTGVRNVSYVRVYVPKGSEILSAEGFSIPEASYFKKPLDGAIIYPALRDLEESETILKPSNTSISIEYDKTVFGNWSMVDPGMTAEIVIKYRIPYKIPLNDTEVYYTLTTQKQSGVDSNIKKTVYLPDGFYLKDSKAKDFYSAESILKRDVFYSIGLKKEL